MITSFLVPFIIYLTTLIILLGVVAPLLEKFNLSKKLRLTRKDLIDFSLLWPGMIPLLLVIGSGWFLQKMFEQIAKSFHQGYESYIDWLSR